MCKWNQAPTFPCPREVVQMGNQCGIDLCEKKAKSRVGTFPIDLGERKKQKVEWEHFLSQLPIWLKWAIKPHITLLASRKGEINQGQINFSVF